MKKQIGVLKHPGFNGGGGGGGYTPPPPSFAPGFNATAPVAPAAPLKPSAPAAFQMPRSMPQPQNNAYAPGFGYNSYRAFDPNSMYQAAQQYNAFGPQTQQYGRDRATFGQRYNNYTRDVNAYNSQAQNYRDTYGSGYLGYNAPSNITPVSMNSLLSPPESGSLPWGRAGEMGGKGLR